MDERLIYIDYLKALAICIVVLLHSGFVPFESTLIACTYSVCVPIFFMVNGYLMLRKERSIRELWKSNCKIFCLIVIWSLILSSSRMLITGEFSGSFSETIMRLLKHSIYLDEGYCNILWFLEALFVLKALNPIFYAFIHRHENNVWYLVLLLGVTTIQIFSWLTNKFQNPLMWYPYKHALLYYVLGYALLSGSVPQSIREKLAGFKYSMVFLYIGIILTILMQYLYIRILQGPLHEVNDAKQWMPENVIWDGYSAFFIVVLTSLICLAFKYTNWKDNAFWQYVGKISLPIYLLHTIFLWHMGVWLEQFDWWATYHFTHLIYPICALGLSILTAWGLGKSRYTGWLVKI